VIAADYDYLRKFLQERCGLVLSADKQYLVESRLLPVARRAGLAGISDLVNRLRVPSLKSLAQQVVEAMTTNETFFFRDKIPFEHFRDIIMPRHLATRASRRRLRIWCAAASSGQEPYSLAMSLSEMGDRLAGWRIEIVATDISLEVLDKARSGLYSHFEVQRGLPIALLLKYFAQIGESWQIAGAIRAMVDFRPLNLLGDFAQLGTFDVVFCRNVLIYFDQATKSRVLERLAQVMDRDAYLVLGAAETVVGLTDRLRPVAEHRGLYMPSAAAVEPLNGKVGPKPRDFSQVKPRPALRVVAGVN
jgi:chemotaxis protein methyltransferase CheR